MIYEGKVRVRACGILIQENKVLLLKHEGLGPAGHLWSPPGGGIEFDETAETTLKKEFIEETNLEIEVKEFLFVNEYRDKRHHAIELFFRVEKMGGELKLGFDPEMEHQILSEIAFFTIDELKKLSGESLHSCLQNIQTMKDLFELTGYYKFVRL